MYRCTWDYRENEVLKYGDQGENELPVWILENTAKEGWLVALKYTKDKSSSIHTMYFHPEYILSEGRDLAGVFHSKPHAIAAIRNRFPTYEFLLRYVSSLNGRSLPGQQYNRLQRTTGGLPFPSGLIISKGEEEASHHSPAAESAAHVSDGSASEPAGSASEHEVVLPYSGSLAALGHKGVEQAVTDGPRGISPIGSGFGSAPMDADGAGGLMTEKDRLLPWGWDMGTKPSGLAPLCGDGDPDTATWDAMFLG